MNVLIESIKKMDSYVGDDKLFPSRSELVRTAIREWLDKQIKIINANFNVYKGIEIIKTMDGRSVKVPLNDHEDNNEFKNYRLVTK